MKTWHFQCQVFLYVNAHTSHLYIEPELKYNLLFLLNVVIRLDENELFLPLCKLTTLSSSYVNKSLGTRECFIESFRESSEGRKKVLRRCFNSGVDHCIVIRS